MKRKDLEITYTFTHKEPKQHAAAAATHRNSRRLVVHCTIRVHDVQTHYLSKSTIASIKNAKFTKLNEQYQLY